MFERCDQDTRAIVEAALDESRRRHNWLGTEHLLLALARRAAVPPKEAAVLLPSGARSRRSQRGPPIPMPCC